MAARAYDAVPRETGRTAVRDRADLAGGPGVPAPGGDIPVRHHPAGRDVRDQFFDPLLQLR